jgi:hypothetical protein
MGASPLFFRWLRVAAVIGCWLAFLAPRASMAAADGKLGMALMSAVVASDGTLTRGAGVTQSSRVSTGNYKVIFGRDVSTCTFAVTSVNTLPVSAAAQPGFGGVGVALAGSDGGAVNAPFNLIVFCAQ